MIAGRETAQRFFVDNGQTYDRIANLSTLGLDVWWKKKILDRIPPDPRRIVDQACGTGILTLKIARRFPQCQVIGVDLQDKYLDIARDKARKLGLANASFVCGGAEEVVFETGVDAVTSSYLAKYVDLARLVANARAMLRPGGVLIMHELTYPANPVCALLWKLDFAFLHTYGVWKYPEWAVSFLELPALVRESRWVEDLTRALKAHQFTDISLEPQTFQVSAIVSARKA